MELKQYEEERLKANREFHLYLGISVPFFAVGLIALLIGEKALYNILGALAVGVGIILMVAGNTKKNKLSKRFKAEVLTKIVKEKFPDGTYEPERGLSWDAMKVPGFFRSPDQYNTEDLVTGSVDGIKFAMSDFDLKERHEHSDGKTTTVSYDTYAKGKFIIFDLNKNLNLTVKVMEEKLFLGDFGTGLKKVKPESIDFNKKFTTLASDEESAFYILTPQIQLKLLDIEKQFSGHIYFAFMNTKLFLAIDDDSDGMEIQFNKPITEESISYIYKELNVPVEIVKELKLDDAKFQELNL